MKITLTAQGLAELDSQCIAVGVYEKGQLSASAKTLNQRMDNAIGKLLKQGDFSAQLGECFLLYQESQRILLVGCGKEAPLSIRDFRKIIYTSVKKLSALKVKTATVCFAELSVAEQKTAWKIKQITEVADDALYTFDQYKSHPKKSTLEEIAIHIHAFKKDAKKLEKALQQGTATANSITTVKNIANQPANICTPTYLAKQAEQLAKKHQTIKVKVLEEKDMEKLDMHALLAVAKGSEQEAKLICLEYHGTSKKQAPIAFIGKGITFDTGGISMKPAEGMIGMKYDMCGAATVLGVIQAAAELNLPLRLVGIMAAVENMPDGGATRPEDIVKSMSGKTIEILNTDAEGRLVLCDALTYCERYHPKTVIDIATLTGAVVIALGHHASGLFSNHAALAEKLLKAGEKTYDRAWQMPLWSEYQDGLKSPFADIPNVAGRAAGSIIAASFLARFTEKFQWAHLDVAGTAAMMMNGPERYATGRPVPMLVQFLLDECGKGIE